MKKGIIVLLAVVVVAIIAIGFYFIFIPESQAPVACTMEAKICPDGSAVGRTGPNCEFSQCPNSLIYTNEEFGFEMIFPLMWQGYSVEKQTWQGWTVDTGEQKYSGVELIIKNPQTTTAQQYQDIPIMVFTPEVWALVSGNNATVAVSAAPIGPMKIGENVKYIFATPPRWYGFTNAVGWQEAVDIVKTFKAF